MYGKGLRHLSVTADTTKYNVGYLPLNLYTTSDDNTANHFRITVSHFRYAPLIFQGLISAMPEIRADLFLAISKTKMCLLTLSVF